VRTVGPSSPLVLPKRLRERFSTPLAELLRALWRLRQHVISIARRIWEIVYFLVQPRLCLPGINLCSPSGATHEVAQHSTVQGAPACRPMSTLTTPLGEWSPSGLSHV
jgi:hypothetical protein